MEQRTITTDTGRVLEFVSEQDGYTVAKHITVLAGVTYVNYIAVKHGAEIMAYKRLPSLIEAMAMQPVELSPLPVGKRIEDDGVGASLGLESSAPSGNCHYCGLSIKRHDCF